MEKPPAPPHPAASAGGAGRYAGDISTMPSHPRRAAGHRRAQSEILSLPDDLSFSDDLGIIPPTSPTAADADTDDAEDLLSLYLDMDKFDAGAPWGADPEPSGSRPRHQHSQSMDGSTTIKPEMLGAGEEVGSLGDAKKGMSAAKLADLSLIDPKRAKRIWANRQSAARSKERKMRYIAELERKMQTLQTEATTLSAQLNMLQRDTKGLTAENTELKLHLQNMEQQVHLQDALNDTLRDEVQRLKVATGQANFPNGGGPMMNFGPSSFGGNQPYYQHNSGMQSLLAAQQLQQLQIHSQHPQQQMHPNQLQHQHLPVDLRLKGAMTSQSQRENTPKE